MTAFSKAKKQMNTFIYNIIMGLSRSNYRLFFFTFPHFSESSAINPYYFYTQERKNTLTQ